LSVVPPIAVGHLGVCAGQSSLSDRQGRRGAM